MTFYTDIAVADMVACGVKNLVSFIETGKADNQVMNSAILI